MSPLTSQQPGDPGMGPCTQKCSVDLGNEQFMERIQHNVGQIVSRFYDVRFAKEETHLGMSR